MSLRPRLITLLRRPPLLPLRSLQTAVHSNPNSYNPSNFRPSPGAHPWNHDPPRHPHERMRPGSSIFVMKSSGSLENEIFKLKISPYPFAVVSSDVVDNPLHPLYKRTEEQYKEKINQFNVYCVIPLTVHKKSSVRNRIRRRVTEAVKRVLAQYGWRENGDPVDLERLEKRRKRLGGKEEEEMEKTARRMEKTAEMMVKGILEDCGAGDAAAAASKAIPERKEKLLGTMAFWPTYKAVSVDWKELVKLVRQGVDKLLALKGYNSKEIKITKQRIGEYQGVRYMARNNNLRESEERGEQMQKLPVKRGTQERKYPVIGDDQDKRRDNFGPVRADQQSAGSSGQERQQQSHRRDDRQNFNNNRADSRPLIRRQGNEGGQQQNTSRNESRPLVRRPGGNDGGQRQSSPVKSNSQLQRESRPTQQQQTQKGRLPMDWRSRGI